MGGKGRSRCEAQLSSLVQMLEILENCKTIPTPAQFSSVSENIAICHKLIYLYQCGEVDHLLLSLMN